MSSSPVSSEQRLQLAMTHANARPLARPACCTFVLFMLELAFAFTLRGEPYERPEERTAEQVLGRERVAGQQFRVEDPVVHDGYTNVYSISTPHGAFVVRGDTMFVRLRRELEAIAGLQARNLAGLTTEAAVKEWTIPLKALGRLASKPGQTLAGIPLGISRLLESSKDSLAYEAGPMRTTALNRLPKCRRISAVSLLAIMSIHTRRTQYSSMNWNARRGRTWPDMPPPLP
jgi:hypothetical protein